MWGTEGADKGHRVGEVTVSSLMEITEGSLGHNVPTISGLGLAQRGALVKIENDGTELEHAFEARHPLALSVGQGATTTGGGHFSGELEKDFLCPICMQTIRDAFLTACGHSFCYSCINTHLQNRQNCPCCSQYLTVEQLFPNFLLNKVSVHPRWASHRLAFLKPRHQSSLEPAMGFQLAGLT